MTQSLSVVVPVHNAEATLAQQIKHLLEILPDITSKFEVLIVDDGSTDHTEESAHELAREYPQLRVIRHAQRQGIPAVVQSSMERAVGDVVFVQDDTNPISHSNLKRMWALQVESNDKMPLAPPGRMANIDGGLVGRLMVWASAEKTKMPKPAPLAGPVQMFRRKMIAQK